MRKPRTALIRFVVLLGAGLVPACSPAPEARSLLGEPLYPMELDPAEQADREAKLTAAREAYDADPEREEAIIWYGRRLAYLGLYREAIAVYTKGLGIHPDSHRLLRHRGHRYITTRRFDEAVMDLTRAAALIEAGVPDEIEPDGLPNRMGIPTSTSHTNIYYHLGLALYLQGDYDAALDAYRRCLLFAKNDDMWCAASYWLYLTLRRLDRDDAAVAALDAADPGMEIIENITYHRLLLLFRGDLTVDEVLADQAGDAGTIDDATLAYGVGMWQVLGGRTERGRELLRMAVEGPAWPAFGHIAAEAELARE